MENVLDKYLFKKGRRMLNARNSLERYINPSFIYRFTQGPDIVSSPEDALQNGINCISLAHLVLRDLFAYRLPPNLQCAEMYLDRSHFNAVSSIDAMQRGDLVWFGIMDSSIEPEDFVPIYEDGKLVNWADFPVKHVAVHTGFIDGVGDPLLLHSTHIEGTNAIWPLQKFAEYKRYKRLFGITRFIKGA